jgi:hypothetical protein
LQLRDLFLKLADFSFGLPPIAPRAEAIGKHGEQHDRNRHECSDDW